MEIQRPANPEIELPTLPRAVIYNLAKYVSFNELKRLRHVCRSFNEPLKQHPRFLNSTLTVGRKFPVKFAEMVRLGGTAADFPFWNTVRCSLHRLERCEFVRNFWKTRMIFSIKRLEMYKVGHKCHVIAHFIGVLPALEELTLNDVSFRSKNIRNPEATRPVQVFCEHNGAEEVFASPDIQLQNTIKKLDFRKMPIIPTCLIQFLTVRTVGALEEYHYIDNTLPENMDRTYRPTLADKQRSVRNILRLNLVTLRKLTWDNCPEDDNFIRTISNRLEFPAFNLQEVHIGQNKGMVHNQGCTLGDIRQFITLPATLLTLSKLKLEFWQIFRQAWIDEVLGSILRCRGLTSLSLTFHTILIDGMHGAINFPPGLELMPHLTDVEIRHMSHKQSDHLSVTHILTLSDLPRNLESLTFAGLVGVNHTPMINFQDRPLKKLSLVDNVNRDKVDDITNQTVQAILGNFPLLEELTLACCENITDTAFTGIPEKTVRLIYQSQSYTLLAHAELNLPPGAQTLSNLKRLKKLSLTSLAVEDVTLFRGFDLPNLRELDLSYTYVSDVGLMQLPLKAPSLEKLAINCCLNVSTLGVCYLLKHSQIQTLTTTQTVLERDHPGLKYSIPNEATRRSAKIFVEHNPREGLKNQ